jgi:hypothetical protein
VRALLKVLQSRSLANGRVHQLVLFTRFYDTLLDIQSWIERSAPAIRLGVFSGPRCAYMKGSPLVWHNASREEVKRRFVNGDIDVLLCTDAAAEGLNLQTADLLVNFDLPWNPMKVEQRIGRIDRIGQRHNVIYVANLAYPGTAEEELYVRLQQRIGGAASTVGAQQTILLPVLPNDLRQLAAKEITREQLEERVRQRLQQAQQRAQAMELTPDELYALYATLDDEVTREPLPITLEQMYSTLVSSTTLKSLGSEVIQTEHGEALLVRGVLGSEPFMLTASRVLYERGVAGRTESLHFATWGDPCFERVVAFVVTQRENCKELSRHEEIRPDVPGSVIRWSLRMPDGQESLIERFEQLPAEMHSSFAAAGELARQTAELAANEQRNRVDNWKRVEAVSAVAGKSHRRSHLLAAGSLLTNAPANALLADINQYLPDATRTLRTTRLEPSVVSAELAFGLLEAAGASLNVPAFYQPYLVNTLKRERAGLKKARRGKGDDELALSDLVERLSKLAKEIGN